MEQIYTIPVNEAFEASAADPSKGCPFCRLYNRLEQNELELILGASMMEPDVRVRTNELGFCRDHFAMMLRRPKRLPLALILESHLAEQYKAIGRGAAFPGRAGEGAIKRFTTLKDSCYVCARTYLLTQHHPIIAIYYYQENENELKFQVLFQNKGHNKKVYNNHQYNYLFRMWDQINNIYHQS